MQPLAYFGIFNNYSEKDEILRVNYSNVEQVGEEINSVTHKYSESVDKYMKMDIENTEIQVFEKEYDEILQHYEAIKMSW